MIKGVTFDMQSPTAKNHGALFNGILTDGILQGCEITTSGRTVYIEPGYLIVAGRLIQISALEAVEIFATTGNVQLVLNADMSKAASADIFEQCYFTTVAEGTELTKEDINDNGVLYQVTIATISASAGGLSVVSKATAAGLQLKYLKYGEQYFNEGDALPEPEEGRIIFVRRD